MKKKFLLAAIAGVMFLALSGHASTNSSASTVKAPAQTSSGAIYQTSTISSLMQGVYDGSTTIKEIKKHGNFGVGTFNGLDGEMIFLNGQVYQVKSTGEVKVAANTQKTPFNDVEFFKSNKKFTLTDIKSINDLESKLDKQLPSQNIFYAFRIKGKFSYEKTRSISKQTKPYSPLSEAAKCQKYFEKNNVSGTILGYRCPTYSNGISVTGYHLHFLSDDRKFGGHDIDCKANKVTVEIQYLYKLDLNLPKDKDFLNVNLSKDQNSNVKKVDGVK